MSTSTNVTRLEAWAAERGLSVKTWRGDQREPDNGCSIQEIGHFDSLIRRTSRDSVETAAWYVINTLERLGVTVP
jgi:hypothetical protein